MAGEAPLFLCLLLILAPALPSEGCPSLCICKWKSGKQAAECVEQGLTEIPSNLNQNTQVLDLSSNPLGTLASRSFQDRNLVNLQKVFLAQCSLDHVAADAFYQLSNLVELDLSRNKLQDVPSPIFSDTSLLRRLTLEGNLRMRRISSDAFANLTYLSVLDLSNCQISAIHPGAFRGLSRLEVLKLHGNRLTVIGGDVLRNLPPLSAFFLHDNPWKCDCHLRDLRLWMTANNVPLGEPPKCDSPRVLQYYSWASIALDKFACKPKIVTLVRDFSVSKGDNATLECRVQASPPATILWETEGILLNRTESSEGLVVESGLDYSLLTIGEALEATSYLCVAENEAGNDTANFTLSVVYASEVGVVGWSIGNVVWLALGVFLIVVLVVLVVGCAVALRYRSLTSDDGKFNGVGILKQLAAKKTESLEVRAGGEAPAEKVPRHETGSSGYGSDQHTPDLTNKAEMQNGPTYSTKAFLYSHPVHDSLTKETYSVHEQCCPGPPPAPGNPLHQRENYHGYSNEFADLAGYHDVYPDVQYSGSDMTLTHCDLVQDTRCLPGSNAYSDCVPVRGDGYASWKRTPTIGPSPDFQPQGSGDRRYSPDEGYAEETIEGTEV